MFDTEIKFAGQLAIHFPCEFTRLELQEVQELAPVQIEHPELQGWQE